MEKARLRPGLEDTQKSASFTPHGKGTQVRLGIPPTAPWPQTHPLPAAQAEPSTQRPPLADGLPSGGTLWPCHPHTPPASSPRRSSARPTQLCQPSWTQAEQELPASGHRNLMHGFSKPSLPSSIKRKRRGKTTHLRPSSLRKPHPGSGILRGSGVMREQWLSSSAPRCRSPCPSSVLPSLPSSPCASSPPAPL